MSSDILNRLAIDKTHTTVTRSSGSSWKRRGIAAVLVAVAVIGAVFLSCNRAVTVDTATVSLFYPTQSFTLLNASGYVVAQRKASVSSKITGRLEWLGVTEGSRVTAGQVIARLENKDLEAAVKQLEAVVTNSRALREQARAESIEAEKSFQRQKQLLASGIISQADFDSADARLKRAIAAANSAEAGIAVATAALQGGNVSNDYSLIRAPFDAVVLTKNADVGDIITPLGAAANAKAAVVTIADPASLEIEADVSESNLSQITQGQPCEITLDSLPGTRLRGILQTIVPTADRSKASVMVKVRFMDKEPRIFPEMSAKVAFLQHEAHTGDTVARLVVTPTAVTTRNGISGLFLVDGSKVRFVPVTVGGKLGDLIEVTGVKSGDKVVVKPLASLVDSSRISAPEKK